MQRIRPDVFLNGARNADGVLRMAEAGAALAARCGKKPFLLALFAQDKELATIVETFVRVLHPACIYLAPLHTSRGTEVYTLTDIYRNREAVAVKTHGSVGGALRQTRGEQTEDAILFIAGLFYLVGGTLAGESK